MVLLYKFRYEIQELIAPITYASPQHRYVRGVVHVSGVVYGWGKPMSNKEFTLIFTFIFTGT
jgi:hypothetical protein